MNPWTPLVRCGCVVGLLSVAACRREEIAVYRVPKETAGSPAALPPGHPDVGAPDGAGNAGPAGARVRWTVPAGWEEKPGTGFRYASFVVPGPAGRTGDLSVTVLSGEAGGLLSNVNRWREQIGLGALDESNLAAHRRSVHPGGRAMTLVDFVSRDALIDGRDKKRLLAAVYEAEGKTWFFKLTGEDALVRGAERDFLAFLASLRGL